MIRKLPTVRKWARCPHCGKKAIIYDDTAECSGVFVKCKNCAAEFELKIQNGEQK